MPAVIEVEESTGVTSGLVRMLKLRDVIPSVVTAYTVAADNDIRHKVVKEANVQQFHALSARFLAYSAIRELLGLIQRYALGNYINRTFVEPFLEIVVQGEP